MNVFWPVLSLLFCTQFVLSRDFYIGMFRNQDFLVAQDVIYKEASHFGAATTTYGRVFQCPITYFRVVDRLGTGRGPFTSIVRGGLRYKYIVVRIKSTYNLPIAVNIYVGCQNKNPSTVRRLPSTRAETTTEESTTGGDDDEGEYDGEEEEGGTTDADGGTTEEPEAEGEAEAETNPESETTAEAETNPEAETTAEPEN